MLSAICYRVNEHELASPCLKSVGSHWFPQYKRTTSMKYSFNMNALYALVYEYEAQ